MRNCRYFLCMLVNNSNGFGCEFGFFVGAGIGGFFCLVGVFFIAVSLEEKEKKFDKSTSVLVLFQVSLTSLF